MIDTGALRHGPWETVFLVPHGCSPGSHLFPEVEAPCLGLAHTNLCSSRLAYTKTAGKCNILVHAKSNADVPNSVVILRDSGLLELFSLSNEIIIYFFLPFNATSFVLFDALCVFLACFSLTPFPVCFWCCYCCEINHFLSLFGRYTFCFHQQVTFNIEILSSSILLSTLLSSSILAMKPFLSNGRFIL